MTVALVELCSKRDVAWFSGARLSLKRPTGKPAFVQLISFGVYLSTKADWTTSSFLTTVEWSQVSKKCPSKVSKKCPSTSTDDRAIAVAEVWGRKVQSTAQSANHS